MPITRRSSANISEEAVVLDRNWSLIARRGAPYILIGVVVLLVGAGVWKYTRRASVTAPESSSASVPTEEQNKKEVLELLQKIKRHILLPADEDPTVATVLDASILSREQPFYKDAQEGDKVVLYVKNRKALIYNPREDILVNVGPVYVTPATTSTPVTNTVAAESAKLTIEVRNGTATLGKGSELAAELKKNSSYSIVDVANASRDTFEKTVLVDFTNGAKSNYMAALAATLNVSVVTKLPPGEKPSTADVVVIVGKQ